MSDVNPVPMRLVCEGCGKLHIDEGEFATKVHHTHSCQFCGMTWRPAIVPTVGVRFLPGFRNEEDAAPATIVKTKTIKTTVAEGQVKGMQCNGPAAIIGARGQSFGPTNVAQWLIDNLGARVRITLEKLPS